jgi:hypothetical protein
MTLKHVRPATINSTRLFAFALIAVGMAVFADAGALPRPAIASLIAWTGGFALLAMDGRKRRAGEPSGQGRQVIRALVQLPAAPSTRLTRNAT